MLEMVSAIAGIASDIILAVCRNSLYFITTSTASCEYQASNNHSAIYEGPLELHAMKYLSLVPKCMNFQWLSLYSTCTVQYVSLA